MRERENRGKKEGRVIGGKDSSALGWETWKYSRARERKRER